MKTSVRFNIQFLSLNQTNYLSTMFTIYFLEIEL